MTGRIRKTHSKEIKFRAALALIKGEQTMSQISQQYGVHQSVLHRWKKSLLEKGPGIFDLPSTKNIADYQTDALKRKIGELTMEVDFLKKSLGE